MRKLTLTNFQRTLNRSMKRGFVHGNKGADAVRNSSFDVCQGGLFAPRRLKLPVSPNGLIQSGRGLAALQNLAEPGRAWTARQRLGVRAVLCRFSFLRLPLIATFNRPRFVWATRAPLLPVLALMVASVLPCAAAAADYGREIRPMLKQYCLGC